MAPIRILLVAFAGLGLAVALFASLSQPQLPTPTPEQATFFETKVRPVLLGNCLPCHGSKSQMAGLRLDTSSGFLRGGDSGPAIVPGEPNKSLLITVIHQTGAIKMPKGGKLKANEIADLEAWVKVGAPWPASAGQKSAEIAPLWSLQPVKEVSPPTVKNKLWVRNPLDSFVAARLEQAGLAPGPEAD